MTDSLLDAANPGGNEEALIASSKYLEKFDQLKRNQLGNENYNEDNIFNMDRRVRVVWRICVCMMPFMHYTISCRM